MSLRQLYAKLSPNRSSIPPVDSGLRFKLNSFDAASPSGPWAPGVGSPPPQVSVLLYPCMCLLPVSHCCIDLEPEGKVYVVIDLSGSSTEEGPGRFLRAASPWIRGFFNVEEMKLILAACRRSSNAPDASATGPAACCVFTPPVL
ncbi:hypothetical protein D4764_01G0021230 [Takifugu flavidus]|uniref:Uncharacterized protein n=1 Tax=Takifugu flavidus TaxID=433684 RepID=A0A5C6PTP3_9TELE|nr:hypothetical protein D4764_01G0021230 [Takifugu flavidus]